MKKHLKNRNARHKSFIKRFFDVITVLISAVCFYFLGYTWKGAYNGLVFVFYTYCDVYFGISFDVGKYIFCLAPVIPKEHITPCVEEVLQFLTDLKSFLDFGIFVICFYTLFLIYSLNFREIRKPQNFLLFLIFLYYFSLFLLLYFYIVGANEDMVNFFFFPIGFLNYFLFFSNLLFLPILFSVIVCDTKYSFLKKLLFLLFFGLLALWNYDTSFSAVKYVILLQETFPSDFTMKFFLESYGLPTAHCMNEEKYLATHLCQEQKEAMNRACSRAKVFGDIKLGGTGPLGVKAGAAATKGVLVYDCHSKTKAFQECVENMMEILKKAK